MTVEEIKEAVKEAMDEKLSEFYIERKQHYDDHRFVQGTRKAVGIAKTAGIWTTVVTLIGTGLYAVFGIER